MRLIDADKIPYTMLYKEDWLKGSGFEAQGVWKKDIDAMPTIEERKTGKWIPVTNGRGGYECDKCNNYAPSYQDGVEWLSKFCPACGARMEDSDE